jgi:hypothetical protein
VEGGNQDWGEDDNRKLEFVWFLLSSTELEFPGNVQGGNKSRQNTSYENARKVAFEDSDKDREQASSELEMLRRKERIEKWRAQKRKKELDTSAGKVWFEGSITKSDAKSDSNNGEAPEKE